MDGSFADELYSESLQISKMQLSPTSSAKQSDSHDQGRVELPDEVDLWDGSGDEYDASSFVREERIRHNEFHTMGYREGITAGQVASSQEGFNIGYKQSGLIGYNWGLVRGVTSALACLPDGLMEKLIEKEEQRNGLKGLFVSVHSISTSEAIGLFNGEIIARQARKGSENSDTSSLALGFPEQLSDVSGLGNHLAELRSLLVESPKVKIDLP